MGAPIGNKNAFRHGIWGKDFNSEQMRKFRRVPPDDLRNEITMLRVTANNAFVIQQRLYKKMESEVGGPQPEDVEGLAKITNSVSLAVTSLQGTVRAYALIHGKDSTVNNAFEEALNSLPIFLDGKFLCNSKADAKDLEEIRVA